MKSTAIVDEFNKIIIGLCKFLKNKNKKNKYKCIKISDCPTTNIKNCLHYLNTKFMDDDSIFTAGKA